MTPDRLLLTRPRTAGEILDDAWRLALADGPLLFALTGLFLVPFFSSLLLLLTLPRIDALSWRCLLTAAVALLAALTGVGSGACQELFRRRTAGESATFAACLKAALWRGVDHAMARALILPALLLGLGCLVLPGVTIWMAVVAVHALIADGKGRRSADLKELGREARFDPGKTAAVVLSRIPLVVLGVINLHLLGGMALWAAGNLAGFDVALVSFALTLGNPVYLVALTLLVWLLLAPYFEASNFLLHLDTRTRQEGLDLFYRVRHCFPTTAPSRAGALLAIVGILLFASPAAADTVSAVRAELGRITEEVKTADPYPGSTRWTGRLEKVADQLTNEGGATKFAWFRRRLTGFAARNRQGALDTLADLDRRLARLQNGSGELSEAELKGLLRPSQDEDDAEPSKKSEKERQPEHPDPPAVKRDVDAPQGRPARSGSQPTIPTGGNTGIMFVGGLLLALLVAALVLWLRSRPTAPALAKVTTAGKTAPTNALPRPDEASAPSLWRRAEELAAKGEYLEGLRALYGAVLALLHGRRFLRYESTRTNGEYVEQVRLAAEVPPGLRGPFERLTTLFEWKWYGERACEDSDFNAGRRLAEEVRELV